MVVLQRFQQRVEGILSICTRRQGRLCNALQSACIGVFDQLAHIIHAGIARRVDFEQIQQIAPASISDRSRTRCTEWRDATPVSQFKDLAKMRDGGFTHAARR